MTKENPLKEWGTARRQICISSPCPAPHTLSKPRAANIAWHPGKVSVEFREQLLGHCPATIWLTGLSGAGKSTLAYELETILMADCHHCCVLDGDNVRHRLNRDLGFSAVDRQENIRRIAEVARLMNDAGLLVITAFISPSRKDREMARAIIGETRFVEVYLNARTDVCESRDPKGLYAQARAGGITNFTGISAPYEPPLTPKLIVDTGVLTLKEATRMLLTYIQQHFLSLKK